MTVAPLSMPAARAHKATPRTYLMCSPTHFAVSYSINAWMDPTQPVDVDLAMAQWTLLRDTYRRLGHTVHEIAPVPGLPDMVFAANAATVVNGRTFGSRFRAPQRRPEAALYRNWLQSNGFGDVEVSSSVSEGEGDFVWTGDVLLAGAGFRTEPAAHAQAAEFLGVPVISLELVDPRYYHLDTALFVLEPSDVDAPAQIAYYPDAFSVATQRVLRERYPDAILATAADAAAFGINGVSDGHHVVLSAGATGLAETLAARGYDVHTVDMSELRKAGGGPKCCTLELRN